MKETRRCLVLAISLALNERARSSSDRKQPEVCELQTEALEPGRVKYSTKTFNTCRSNG